MELDQCIKTRRSVRAYTQEPVTKEQIEAVMEAGTWAPTGMGRQPWRFIIIENKDTIKLVSEETKALLRRIMPPQLAEQFNTQKDNICYNAPMLVLVCTEKSHQWDDVNLLDSVLATENMFLKACELGLGTCYMGFVSNLNREPHVLKKIGVPENHYLAVPFIIGHPKTLLEPGKRSKPNIISWQK